MKELNIHECAQISGGNPVAAAVATAEGVAILGAVTVTGLLGAGIGICVGTGVAAKVVGAIVGGIVGGYIGNEVAQYYFEADGNYGEC